MHNKSILALIIAVKIKKEHYKMLWSIYYGSEFKIFEGEFPQSNSRINTEYDVILLVTMQRLKKLISNIIQLK